MILHPLRQVFDWECFRVGFATVGGIISGAQWDTIVSRITALCCLGYVALKFYREWKRRIK